METDLFDIAMCHDVDIISGEFLNNESVSTMTQSGKCYIGIDRAIISSGANCRVHLAHEIGHCVTGAFYNPYAELDIRQKHENRADRWAINALIPSDELQCVVNAGTLELCEIAELFDVTEDFARKAVEYYASQGRLCILREDAFA